MKLGERIDQNQELDYYFFLQFNLMNDKRAIQFE